MGSLTVNGKKMFLPLCLAVFLLAAGCGGGGSSPAADGGPPPVGTGSVSLAWTAPASNTDGSPLFDLAGYKVYYGTSSGNYSQSRDAGNVSTYQLTGLIAGSTYYIVVTAYNSTGAESGYSNEIGATVQ
ncbi:MAG: hypothetical protein Kow0025_04890 [Thermodesulfovibrionales bacterium]